MNGKSLILSAAALFMAFSISGAQSFFDFSFPDIGSGQQYRQEDNDRLEFDYDVDFQYYFDNREFKASSDIFAFTETFNSARLSPSIGFRFRQDRNTTHRLMLGTDIIKNLGENPTTVKYYSDDEHDPSLKNSRLFKEIFYYYNLSSRIFNGRFDLFAGIHPRTAMEGEYSRAIFSDIYKVMDPNIEGVTLKYRTPRLYAEVGGDITGYLGIDRRESFMVCTAGNYDFLEWLSAGWDGVYSHIGSSLVKMTRIDMAMMNPFLKVDFSKNFGFEELSLKAGALASYQQDHYVDDTHHFPLAAEGIFTVKKWGLGMENTVFYGDNMMVYKNSAYYNESLDTSTYTDMLYLGEPFYFTHRGFSAGYDRLEIFFEPAITDAVSLKISAVGHFIFPGSDLVGSFLGWQGRASLVFDLDAIRHPQRTLPRNGGGQGGRKQQERRHGDGPSIRL